MSRNDLSLCGENGAFDETYDMPGAHRQVVQKKGQLKATHREPSVPPSHLEKIGEFVPSAIAGDDPCDLPLASRLVLTKHLALCCRGKQQNLRKLDIICRKDTAGLGYIELTTSY